MIKRRYIWAHFALMIILVLFVMSIGTAVAQDASTFPLAERGSFGIGARQLSFVDEERGGQTIRAMLWYPAIVPEGADPSRTIMDAAPDMSEAPYPLLVYSHGTQGNYSEFSDILLPLVARGFVVAGITHSNSGSAMRLIDRPVVGLFVIDQLTALDEDQGSDLAGVMDTDQIGVIGTSGGTFTALPLGGVRVDTQAASLFDDEVLLPFYPDWDWDAMAAYHDQIMPPAEDGLWPSTTDPRIGAVITYLPCAPLYFGERGLAAATVPTLLIAGTQDTICSYVGNAVRIYTELGSPERYLVSLVGAQHTLPNMNIRAAPVIQQFVTAFLGYKLQGKTEYAQYLTADYASSLDNVVWGVDQAAVDNYSLFPGSASHVDGGAVAIGDAITGEIANLGTRMDYSLSLDADTTLNLHVNATGPGGQGFNPILFVYDAQGDLLFWNDEAVHGDASVADAGLDGINLAAGSYTIEVRGFADVFAGSYELILENAGSD